MTEQSSDLQRLHDDVQRLHSAIETIKASQSPEHLVAGLVSSLADLDNPTASISALMQSIAILQRQLSLLERDSVIQIAAKLQARALSEWDSVYERLDRMQDDIEAIKRVVGIAGGDDDRR